MEIKKKIPFYHPGVLDKISVIPDDEEDLITRYAEYALNSITALEK